MSTVVGAEALQPVVRSAEASVVVLEQGGRTVVARQQKPAAVVITRGVPGERGARGLPGPAGGETTVTVGPTILSGHSAVAVDEQGLLVPADSTNPAHLGAVIGVIADAYSPGEEAVVQTSFVLEHVGWNWGPGPILVGAAGALVQALGPDSLFAQTLGKAISPTRVLVGISPPITLA